MILARPAMLRLIVHLHDPWPNVCAASSVSLIGHALVRAAALRQACNPACVIVGSTPPRPSAILSGGRGGLDAAIHHATAHRPAGCGRAGIDADRLAGSVSAAGRDLGQQLP